MTTPAASPSSPSSAAADVQGPRYPQVYADLPVGANVYELLAQARAALDPHLNELGMGAAERRTVFAELRAEVTSSASYLDAVAVFGRWLTVTPA